MISNLISNIARTKKYIILSTGAGDIGDVKKVLKFINKYHNDNNFTLREVHIQLI